MMPHISRKVAGLVVLLGMGVCLATGQTQPAPIDGHKVVGTVRTIAGNVVTVHTDAGSDVGVVIQDSSRLLQVGSGQKDLKDATAIHLQDVQVGDRMLVRGQPSDDGKSVTVLTAVVMKAAEVTAKQEREKEDWRKRGIGGLVIGVDSAAGSVTISTGGMGTSKPVKVIASKAALLRRYSPDSVKFDDATAAPLEDIKPGDQLRARGTRNADGSEFTAEEIVSGTFRNIAGTVTSTDAANQSLSVMDLVTRQTVSLKVDADSQLHKLPEMIAQRIAMRLRGGTGQASGNGASPPSQPANGKQTTGPGGISEGQRPAGPPDFQQMLARMPAVSLADLQKGDAVMIVSTMGGPDRRPTAVTLLTGVEAILAASANNSGRAAMLLSPWNLGGAGAGDVGSTP